MIDDISDTTGEMVEIDDSSIDATTRRRCNRSRSKAGFQQ